MRDLHAPGVEGVSLELHAGEILGLAGLVGAGRTELARAIFGAERPSGRGRAGGRRRAGGRPAAALRAGLAMIPESRKDEGLLFVRSEAENVTLAAWRSAARGRAPRRRAPAPPATCWSAGRARGLLGSPGGSLSGGNQQKVLLARMLLCEPQVLIADEPTRGVDVGAKRAIYDFLVELAEEGLGVLLISSELEEVIGLAHRVLVMRAGRLVAELEGERMTEGAILAAAFATRRRGRHDAAPGGRSGAGRTERLRATGIVLPFTVLFVVLSLASSSFFTKANLLNILDQQSATLIIAAAGTLVVIAGGIDLSVGAIYGFAGVIRRTSRCPQRRRSRSCWASAPGSRSGSSTGRRHGCSASTR